MSADFTERLDEFAKREGFLRQKGPLSVGVQLTDRALKDGLPIDPETLMTARGGQVQLSGPALKRILASHGIRRTLSSEGGRTSRGSISNMKKYIDFLNDADAQGDVDLSFAERYWVAQVNDYFAAQPLSVDVDDALSLRTLVNRVIAEAKIRESQMGGATVVGTVLQHLVGAKLDLALKRVSITHHTASTADQPGGRAGDFEIGDTVVHVTTSPSEALIAKAIANIKAGRKPIIVTTGKGVATAEGLSETAGYGERIEVFEVEQFIALNIHELANFDLPGRRETVTRLVDTYNEIIDTYEHDPGLRIEM